MNRNSGFTLIELIVSLAVGTFILMAILATLNDFLRYHLTTRTNESLLTTSETVLNDLALEIQNTQKFETQFPATYTLTQLNSKVIYRLENKQIVKETDSGDRLVLTPKNVSVQDFTIVDRSGVQTLDDLTPPLLEIHLKFINKSHTVPDTQLEKTTTISSRFRKYDQHITPPQTGSTPPPASNPPLTPALIASPPPDYQLDLLP